jgi:hypothetical protein
VVLSCGSARASDGAEGEKSAHKVHEKKRFFRAKAYRDLIDSRSMESIGDRWNRSGTLILDRWFDER